MITVIVRENGNVNCIWSDLIDWQMPGICTVHRASNVEFNNSLQRWTVQFIDGSQLEEKFIYRELALNAEVQQIELEFEYFLWLVTKPPDYSTNIIT